MTASAGGGSGRQGSALAFGSSLGPYASMEGVQGNKSICGNSEVVLVENQVAQVGDDETARRSGDEAGTNEPP